MYRVYLTSLILISGFYVQSTFANADAGSLYQSLYDTGALGYSIDPNNGTIHVNAPAQQEQVQAPVVPSEQTIQVQSEPDVRQVPVEYMQTYAAPDVVQPSQGVQEAELNQTQPIDNPPIPRARPNFETQEQVKVLQPISTSSDYAHATFYDPDVTNSMEGGHSNSHGERVTSVEDAIATGRPVTVAADDRGSFGATCNHVPRKRDRGDRRCTILIYAQGFDRLYPKYRQKFVHLPADSFIATIADTGGDFHYSNGHHYDIAVRNRSLKNAAPGFFKSEVRWTKIKNPCGTGSAASTCKVAEYHLAPSILAMLRIRDSGD